MHCGFTVHFKPEDDLRLDITPGYTCLHFDSTDGRQETTIFIEESDYRRIAGLLREIADRLAPQSNNPLNAELLEALQPFLTVATHASRTNPNTTFIDTRDWEIMLSKARVAIKRATEG